MFTSYKDDIIQQYKESIDYYTKATKEQSDFIFTLMSIISQKEQEIEIINKTYEERISQLESLLEKSNKDNESLKSDLDELEGTTRTEAYIKRVVNKDNAIDPLLNKSDANRGV